MSHGEDTGSLLSDMALGSSQDFKQWSDMI